jgi:hypothetical protein
MHLKRISIICLASVLSHSAFAQTGLAEEYKPAAASNYSLQNGYSSYNEVSQFAALTTNANAERIYIALKPKRNTLQKVGKTTTWVGACVLVVGGMTVLTHGEGNVETGSAMAGIGAGLIVSGIAMIIVGKVHNSRLTMMDTKPNEVGVAYSF